ncbi:DUF3857 domain-containing protein [Nostoc ellipsosporum NOK]|nr:DUF3857 domain-containing protein [Nostoc ellipsosporum NOK]
MTYFRSAILLLATFLCASTAFSQEAPKFKFGRVDADEFQKKVYSVDSGANAVILAEIGASRFIGNNSGGFTLEFKVYRRAHVLNKNGYGVADVSIPLYIGSQSEEKLVGLRAATYNVENGKVVSTKLEKSSVFKDKINKYWVSQKFTLPNVREGSIIEYEYTIESPFLFNLQPWYFQGENPRLWSEYQVAIPQFFNYVTLKQGYQPFVIETTNSKNDNFTLSDSRTALATERYSFQATIAERRWAMKDVPSLKEESFTSTLNNHISKIEFQLSENRPPLEYRRIMGSWTDVMGELMKDDGIGQINANNAWLSDAVDEAAGKATDKLQRAKNIYAWVRDNLTCTSEYGYRTTQSMKEVLRKKNGNVADINLLLIAMLRKAGIAAEAVILSTRSHGYTYSMYPLLDRFNYLIAAIGIDDKVYYLDAADRSMGFGYLHYRCYNGHARVINADATPLEFSADSLTERELASVFIVNDSAGRWLGNVQKRAGYFESARLRKTIKEKGKESIFTDIARAAGVEMNIIEQSVDSLAQMEGPVDIKYKFTTQFGDEDLIYFNPMMDERFKDNPFKSAQRQYPVEMPFTMDQTYLLRIEVPKGYVVDEIPKQMVVKLNEDNDGIFEYRISQGDNAIALRCRLVINRTFFAPEEYETLREFFNLIVKKHSEQIVFKKKK